jgi:hypothetical protein
MDRRNALRLLATGTALQLAPHNLLAVLRESRRLVDTPVAPCTLNAHHTTSRIFSLQMAAPWFHPRA